MSQLRIGIVGSRRRDTLHDRKIVFDLVRSAVIAFPEKELMIVSGGARGPDTFAREAAELHKLRVSEHPIQKNPPATTYRDFVERAHARNRAIAQEADLVFALVHRDRRGGMENTISHAKQMNKKYFLVDEDGKCFKGD